VPAREIITESDPCALAERWGVALETIERLWAAAEEFKLNTLIDAEIISGYRTAAEQRRLSRQGRPTAPDALSTHRSCPATGVDVSLGFAPDRFTIVTWGRIAFNKGLRWGGGGAVDQAGIPLDWGHVDVGPRNP